MFEGIGRRQDADDRKRQATSVALTTLLCAAGLGFWMGVAAWVVAEPVAEAVSIDDDVQHVELAMAVPDTPLPEAPAPKIVQKGEPDPEPSPEPQPSPDAAPTEPRDPPEEPLRSTTGHAEGSSEGDPDGTLDGKLDDTGDGDGDGDGPRGFGDVHAVHVGELQWRKRPAPDWPSAANELGLQDASCLADVVFADTGEPVSVTIRGCPSVFHQDTRAALLASRVYPFEVEGRKVTVKSTIRVRYVLR